MAIMVTIPHLLCNLELASHSNNTDWAHGANSILYYAYPVVLTLGIIFGLLNAVVTAKMASTSHECYLAAFNVSATLLLVVASMHHLPAYASRKVTGSAAAAASTDVGAYQLTVAPYLPALHSIFSVTCTWLLAVVALQRMLSGLAVAAVDARPGAGRRGGGGSSVGDGSCLPTSGTIGKRLCGVLASALVLVTALVISLPQFWEFEVADLRSEHASGDGGSGAGGSSSSSSEGGSPPPLVLPHNCTVTRGGLVRRSDSLVAGYLWYNWFFLVVSFVLPYAVVPMMLPPIACSPHYIYTYAGDGGRQKVKYRPGSSQRNERKEARDFDRLLTAVIVFYLVLSVPANAANTLANPPTAASRDAAHPGSESNGNLLLGFGSQLTISTIRTVFDVTAYSFFSISFFLYLGFSDKYRTSLYGLCCCQKVAQPYYY